MKIELLRSSLKEGFKDQYRRIEDRCSGLSQEALAFQPDEKSWSVGQCLFHLWLTNDMYLSKLSITIRTSRHNEPEKQDYESNWMGRKFINMVGPTGGENTPVPKPLEPNPERVPEDIVQKCLDQLVAFDEFLIESDGTDLMKTKMPSPMMAMLRFQLGDVFKFLHAHNERHMNQVDRIMRLSVFPSGSAAKSASVH